MPGVLFCPCPPLLVPEVAQGAAPELAGLRAICEDAVRALLVGAPSVLVVGPGPADLLHPGSASGTLTGFGVPVRVGGSSAPDLPLALTIGAWLLDAAGSDVPRRYVQVGPAAHGPEGPWPGQSDAILVMGDGPARLTERAPGGWDPAAAGYDDAVVKALRSSDPGALAELDAAEGLRLMAAGVPAWRAVGAALARTGGAWSADLLAHEVPYGVSYVVARWQ